MERAREAQRLLPPPAIAPLDNDAFRKHAEEARKRMEELQRQFQAQQEDLRKQFEKQQLELREKLGGVRLPEVNLGRRGEDRRLGAQVGTPEEVVSEQLNIPRGQGQVIASVHPDSAAAKAGLQPRDILLELNGKPVSSIPAEFAKMLDEIKSETPVDLVVLRKGKKENIKGLTLPEVKQEGRDRIQLNPGVGILRVRPGAEGVATTTTHNGDRFTTTHQEGGLNITIAGSIADGKAKATAIQILDGRTANKYEDVSQVPEQFREKVQLLLELSEKSTFKSERKKAAP